MKRRRFGRIEVYLAWLKTKGSEIMPQISLICISYEQRVFWDVRLGFGYDKTNFFADCYEKDREN